MEIISEDDEGGIPTRRMHEYCKGGYNTWGEMLIDGQWVKHGVYANKIIYGQYTTITRYIYDKGVMVDSYVKTEDESRKWVFVPN